VVFEFPQPEAIKNVTHAIHNMATTSFCMSEKMFLKFFMFF